MITNLLRAERIKLFSTRAPWWCLAIALVAPLGFTALFFALAGPEIPPTVGNTQLASGKARFALGGSGHIAGIINPPSKAKGYWTNNKRVKSADRWFESAEHHDGSWWTDWVDWLKSRSGDQGAPPKMGSTAHPPIVPAPGTYVLEK